MAAKNPKEEKGFWEQHLGSLVALLIGLSTIGSGFYSGLFDVKRERLELENAELQFDIKKFGYRRDSIQKAIAFKQDSLRISRIELANARQNLDKVSSFLNEKNAQINKLNSSYSEKIKKLKTPEPVIVKAFMPKANSFAGINLVNNGLGVMYGDEYKVYLSSVGIGGKSFVVNSSDTGMLLLDKLGLFSDETSTFSFGYLPKYFSLAPGREHMLIGLKKADYNSVDQERLAEVESKIFIVIKYHGRDGTHGQITWGNKSLLK